MIGIENLKDYIPLLVVFISSGLGFYLGRIKDKDNQKMIYLKKA